MTMRKSTIVAKIEKMGYGRYIIENADTAPNQVRLGCEYLGDDEDPGPPGDYYGEFRGNYPWIDPRLEKLADKAGGYWEWENPAVISLYLD
jgi:hypothetical protein